MYWREIRTPANPRHCRDTSEVKAWHFSSAMSPLSPAPEEPGIQMTGALLTLVNLANLLCVLIMKTCPCQSAEAVLTSTHNLCFRSKIRKISIPLETPAFFFYIKVGFKEAYISRTFFRYVECSSQSNVTMQKQPGD